MAQVHEEDDTGVGECGVGEEEVGEARELGSGGVAEEGVKEELEAAAREGDGREVHASEVGAHGEVCAFEEQLEALYRFGDEANAEEDVVQRIVDYVGETLREEGREIRLLDHELDLDGGRKNAQSDGALHMAAQCLENLEQRPLPDVVEFERGQLGEVVVLNHRGELVEIVLLGLAVETNASQERTEMNDVHPACPRR